jgi:hypothetical protein
MSVLRVTLMRLVLSLHDLSFADAEKGSTFDRLKSTELLKQFPKRGGTL